MSLCACQLSTALRPATLHSQTTPKAPMSGGPYGGGSSLSTVRLGSPRGVFLCTHSASKPSAFLGEIFYLASLVCLLCPLPRRSPLLSRRGPSGDQRRADLARTASPVCLRVMGTRAARQALMKTTQGEGRFLRAKKTQRWVGENRITRTKTP